MKATKKGYITSKKFLKTTWMLLLLLVLCSSLILVTGCGSGSSGGSSGPEKNINPITGETCQSELPARPVMVSIPNDTYGAVPQSNISYADIIYEFPVEGQLTRLQAVYYSQFPEEFGPTRSVRYYFVDLAREYKAAHVGYGWGKKAHSYMKSCDIPHINGMQDTELFYRNETKTAPNNAYIKWADVEKRAEKEGWFNETQTIEPFAFYSDDYVKDLEGMKADAQKTVEKLANTTDPEEMKELKKAEGILAVNDKSDSVKVSSLGCNSKCVYNEETGLYDRYWYDEPYIDKETQEQMSFSNVLVQKVQSNIMKDSETGLEDEKGRLEIDMNSGGDALLFTRGEVIEGTWSKKTPDSRTVFTDKYGNQFRMSEGKTWVYVVDQNMKVEYETTKAEETPSTTAE